MELPEQLDDHQQACSREAEHVEAPRTTDAQPRCLPCRQTKRRVTPAALDRKLLSVGLLDVSDLAASGHFADRGLTALSGRVATKRGGGADRLGGRLLGLQ